jgi:hypothetical protein
MAASNKIKYDYETAAKSARKAEQKAKKAIKAA